MSWLTSGSSDYGAAAKHVEQLMIEREDFIAASKAQTSRVQELEQQLLSVSEMRDTLAEQNATQLLLIEQLSASSESKSQLIDKLQSTMRCMWGVYERRLSRRERQSLRLFICT
eukprot:5507554-Pleurochrysis_carterae.AAC.5